MANVKISDMPSLPVPPVDEPIVPVVSDGTNYQSPLSTLLTMPDSAVDAGNAPNLYVQGGAGSGEAANGSRIYVTAGSASGGTTYNYGGSVYVRGGGSTGGATNSYGGAVYFRGGDADYIGGPVKIYGGGTGQYGGGVHIESASSANYGGAILNVYQAINFRAGDSFSVSYTGSDILFSPGGGYSNITRSGEIKVNNNASLIKFVTEWRAGETPNGDILGNSDRALRVKSVTGCLGAANAGASTAVVVKCASGVAPGAGTALTSNSVDCAGTPNANQTLTLSATLADIELAAGDRLVCVTTGVFALSAGSITVWATPI